MSDSGLRRSLPEVITDGPQWTDSSSGKTGSWSLATDVQNGVQLTHWKEEMPTIRTLTGLRCGPIKFNKAKWEVPHLDRDNPNTGWSQNGLRAALRTWGASEWEAGHDPEMFTHRSKRQKYPGLHQKQVGQQIKRDTDLPFYSAHVRPHLEWCIHF